MGIFPLAGAVTEIVSGFLSHLFLYSVYDGLFEVPDPSSQPNLIFYPLMYPKCPWELKLHSNGFEKSAGHFNLCSQH